MSRTPTRPLPARPDFLRPVPPPPDSEYMWRRLMNFLFVHEQDDLFVWLRSVRAVVEDAEKKAREAA